MASPKLENAALYARLEGAVADVVRATSYGDHSGSRQAWHVFASLYRGQRAIIGIRDPRAAHALANDAYKVEAAILSGRLAHASGWALRISRTLAAAAPKVTGVRASPLKGVALELAQLMGAAHGLGQEIANQNAHGIARAIRAVDREFKANRSGLRAKYPTVAARIGALITALTAADRQGRTGRVTSLSRQLTFLILGAQARLSYTPASGSG